MLHSFLKPWIKKRLQGYKIALNQPNTGLPFTLTHPKKVAVIGGGIAGISAAANLGERGFQVDLFEKDYFLGGKVGSWTFESKGETLRVEHGFHAFFKQYFNLLAFMEKTGAAKHLIPIDDYLIYFKDKTQQSFKKVDTTPLLNILSMQKLGVYTWKEMLTNRYAAPLADLFRYSSETTFRQYDHMHLAEFMAQTHVPEKMKMVFSSFARAFFAEPEDMSTAELIKSFHFYFLSNDLGLVYDVLDDDFEHTFTQPAISFLEKNNVTITYQKAIQSIQKIESGFEIEGNTYDYVVLALDVKHLPILIQHSPDLHSFSRFYRQTTQVKPSARYAVWRLYTNAFEKGNPPYFVFTDRLECLDSVTFYHKLEKESKKWSQENKGGIFELHSYALPQHLTDEEDIKKALLDELLYYYPELKGMEIKHSYFQHRNDFSAFHTGLYAERPTVETEVPGLYLAGDWVKMDNTTMLMEAAYTSGALAANSICTKEGLQESPLFSVPKKGLLA